MKLDKSKCQIRICQFSDIRNIFEKYHYKKGAMGGGISVCFAMFIDGILVGGSVIGKPRHEKKYKNCIDIRRMALVDSAPCNSESWFLSQIIKWLASNTDYDFVLSYSDKTVGHSGTIYKAANFKSIGETTPTKYILWNGKTYHPRSLSIDRPYSYLLREAVKTGDAIIKTGLPKTIWIYEISCKLKKKKKTAYYISKNLLQTSLF
jgi:hypothetical protein